VRLLVPDDPQTTATDPGFDLAFRITGGSIVSLKRETTTTAFDPAEGKTELILEGTQENAVMEIGVSGCPFLTQFSMEIFRPAIAGTKIYYGQREVLSLPDTPTRSYTDPRHGLRSEDPERLRVRLELLPRDHERTEAVGQGPGAWG
jgi:hypothetical protein